MAKRIMSQIKDAVVLIGRENANAIGKFSEALGLRHHRQRCDKKNDNVKSSKNL